MSQNVYRQVNSNDEDEVLELQSLASSGGSGRLESGLGNADSSSRATISSRSLSDFEDYNGTPAERAYSTIGYVGGNLLALSATQDLDLLPGGSSSPHSLSIVHGLGLVIGAMIGPGIFASPGQVDFYAGSVGSSLLVWLISGLLSWTGASSFAELGSAIPLNGGAQAYLNYTFGSLASFLFSWAALTVLRPGTCAIQAIVFGEYLGRGVGISKGESLVMSKALAIAALLTINVLNGLSTRLGATIGQLFLLLKLVLLATISVAGLVHLARHPSSGSFSSGLFQGASQDAGDYALAFYGALWAYDGWDNVNYVAAELKNPARAIPRVIHVAVPTVTIFYILTNVGYFALWNRSELTGQTTVALIFAEKLLGQAGVIVFAILISASCLGTLNASTFSTARLVQSSAQEGFLPAVFADTHKTLGTPVNALCLQFIMATIFVLIGQFASLLTFYGIVACSFFFVTVFGVIYLRIYQPDLRRPYKTKVFAPIIFCCVAIFLVMKSVLEKPIEATCSLLFILSGIPVYVWRFGHWRSFISYTFTKARLSS